jgi:hypothetical protein
MKFSLLNFASHLFFFALAIFQSCWPNTAQTISLQLPSSDEERIGNLHRQRTAARVRHQLEILTCNHPEGVLDRSRRAAARPRGTRRAGHLLERQVLVLMLSTESARGGVLDKNLRSVIRPRGICTAGHPHQIGTSGSSCCGGREDDDLGDRKEVLLSNSFLRDCGLNLKS